LSYRAYLIISRSEETAACGFFFSDDDYQEYIALMADSCRRYEVDVWAYCLMSNHVHFIAVPSQPDNFRHAMGEAHRRYTRHVNFREKWRGHLWGTEKERYQ